MKEVEGFKKEIDLVDYVLTHNYSELDRNQSSRTCISGAGLMIEKSQ